eukprot:TRINITY_DN3273_c0_g1_i1.p1 TRINITY_DN3273_c0_g1~~TRINITY_DN3273_c0_g1_i1.p1  ORF type:complete len:349 (+),score=76.26 TRINITY_DN3273_c0_g1_i1:96-1142(+)
MTSTNNTSVQAAHVPAQPKALIVEQKAAAAPAYMYRIVDIFSGFGAGIAVTVVGHPFETIKVRLQTQPHGAGQLYKGFLDCASKTIKWEGFKGFYKGVASPFVGQMFFRPAMFMTNAQYLRWRHKVHGGVGPLQMSNWEYAAGGAITWGVCTTIECPLQFASSQLQVEIVKQKSVPGYKGQYKGVGDFLVQCMKKRGPLAMYRGVIPHLGRNIPGGACHFGLFEMTRREWAKHKGVPVDKIGLWANLLAGAWGGFWFFTVTYPCDVIKSAMQGDDIMPAKRKYQGVVDCAKKLWAEGGWKRFTRGFSACAIRALPANGCLLTAAFRIKEVGYKVVNDKFAPGKKAAAY